MQTSTIQSGDKLLMFVGYHRNICLGITVDDNCPRVRQELIASLFNAHVHYAIISIAVYRRQEVASISYMKV